MYVCLSVSVRAPSFSSSIARCESSTCVNISSCRLADRPSIPFMLESIFESRDAAHPSILSKRFYILAEKDESELSRCLSATIGMAEPELSSTLGCSSW